MNEKTKVLIVEDEGPLAMMMVSVLTEVGCEVETAWTGKRGMEKASEKKYEIIILDYELPDIAVFEICSELSQRHISCKTPIILVCTRPQPEDKAEVENRNVVDYLIKPVDATELIYKVVYHAKAKTIRGGVSATEEATA